MTPTRSVLPLPIASIAVPSDRIGFYDADHAAWLGSDMLADGQHDPIHVRRNGNAAKLPWTLVAGLHRLRGAEQAGMGTIDAIQVADASTDTNELRRLELSENLDHRARRPIERAIFMAERARLEEAVDHPEHVGETQLARASRLRQSPAATVAAGDWRDRTAAAMGCSLRSLERHQRIHREIVLKLPDLAQALNFHLLGESLSAMTRLAQVGDISRRLVAQAIIADPDISSVEEAYARVTNGSRQGERTPANDHEGQVAMRWARMTKPQRHSFAVGVVAAGASKAMAQEMVAVFAERGLLS